MREVRATRARALVWLALAAASVLGAVCEAPTGSDPENLAPETYLSISDAELDTTFYVLDLSWWGEDADGEVERFEYWWEYFQPEIPGTTSVSDTFSVTHTREVFTLPVSGTRAQHTFHVRAIDDDGLVDPTPVAQAFRLANALSRISFGEDLARPTRSLPGVTFSFTSTDPDGDDTIVGYLGWFEGQDRIDDGFFVEGTSAEHITIGPELFPSAGTVTLHVQSIDESVSASADTASHTWEVIDTAGKRVLVVDHHPDDFQFGAEIDAFYLDAVTRAFGADAIIDISLDDDGAFQTDEEVALAFTAFESLVWYTGFQPNNRANSLARRDELRVATSGMRTFAETGGEVLLQSTFAFGDLLTDETDIEFHAAWDSVEAGDFLEVEWPYERFVQELNTNFSVLPFPGNVLQVNPALASQPLQIQSPFLYQECYPLPPNATAVAWFEPGLIQVTTDQEGPVYNDSDYHAAFSLNVAGDGAFTALLLPLARANGNGSAAELLDSLLGAFASTSGRRTPTGASRHLALPESRRPGPIPAWIREGLDDRQGAFGSYRGAPRFATIRCIRKVP